MKLALSQALQPLQRPFYALTTGNTVSLKASQDSSPQPQYVLYRSTNIFRKLQSKVRLKGLA